MNDYIELLTRIDERQRNMANTLENILKEARITNGRITKLEQKENQLSGAWKAIAILGGIVSTVLGFILLLW